jgi:hypothetical protein
MASKQATTSAQSVSAPGPTEEPTPAETHPTLTGLVQSLDKSLSLVRINSIYPIQKATQLGVATGVYLQLVQELLNQSAITHRGEVAEYLKTLPDTLLGRILTASREFWRENKGLLRMLPQIHKIQ